MSGYIINTDSHAIEERERKTKEQTQQQSVKKFEFDVKNYLNTRLTEGETEKEIKVRILPVSATNGDIFFAINIHSLMVDKGISKSGFKTFVCLNDLNIPEHDGRGCPFCNRSKELFKEANTVTNEGEKKTLIKSAYSYQSKVAYIVRVIERGKEDEGVKFWRFNARTDGQGIYDKLMKIYKQRKEEAEMAGQPNYSIFDLNNGRDITIKLNYVPSTKKTSIDIIDSGFQTPLSRDVDLANKWISDSKNWRDVYALKSYEYLELIAEGKIPVYDTTLQKWVEKVDNSAYSGEKVANAQNDVIATPQASIESQPMYSDAYAEEVAAAQQQYNTQDDDLPF